VMIIENNLGAKVDAIKPAIKSTQSGVVSLTGATNPTIVTISSVTHGKCMVCVNGSDYSGRALYISGLTDTALSISRVDVNTGGVASWQVIEFN